MEEAPDTDPKAEAARLGSRVREHYEGEVDQTHRSLLSAWIAFGVTFGLCRGLTYGIREGVLPNVNIETPGIHIHHYVWGILLLLIVGYLALVDDKAKYHRFLSVAYGVGAALIIDEFALLLNLRDVYFADEGRWSVDLGLGIVFILGVYVTAARFWHSAIREVIAFARRLLRR